MGDNPLYAEQGQGDTGYSLMEPGRNATDSAALNWNDGQGGDIFSWQQCEPFCGQPCNPVDGIMCLLCFWCCGPCTMAKLYAYSLDQECTLMNHALIACCGCQAGMPALIRHNIRVQKGIGKPAKDLNGLIGDLFTMSALGPCGWCQILRAVPVDAWKDWMSAFSEANARGAHVMRDWRFLRTAQ